MVDLLDLVLTYAFGLIDDGLEICLLLLEFGLVRVLESKEFI